MKKPTEIPVNKKPVEILINMIRIPAYQHALDEKRVKNIVKEWDDTLMNPIRVSLREDGYYYIFDGQHTMKGYETEYPEAIRIPGFVYEGLTYEEECEYFIKLNTAHKNPTYNDILKANIESGNEMAKGYYEALKESGIPFSFGNRDAHKTFTCHSCAFRLYKKFGEEVFKTSLRAMKDSRMDPKRKYTVYVFKALMSFIGTVGMENVNLDIVAKTLNSIDVDADLKREANKLAPSSATTGANYEKYYGMAFCEQYNARVRRKIDISIFLMTSPKAAAKSKAHKQSKGNPSQISLSL